MLRDQSGNYLPLWNAMLAAQALNRYHGVRQAPLEPPPDDSSQDGVGPGYVYFVLAGQHIKVGYSATPFGRASDVAGSVPEPPSLIVVVPGKRKDEAAVHEMFSADRQQGEWFSASTKLLNLMTRCAQARRVVLGTANIRKTSFR